jgi:hypothetical protein
MNKRILCTAPLPSTINQDGDCSPTKWRRDVLDTPPAGKQQPANASTPAARRAPAFSDQDGAEAATETPTATVGFRPSIAAAGEGGLATPQECAHMVEAVEAIAETADQLGTPGACLRVLLLGCKGIICPGSSSLPPWLSRSSLPPEN